MGIDTSLQKMHDYEVRKVDMWLVVEEVRAHQSVMSWQMVFDVVVSKVGASGSSVNIEMSLAGAILDLVEVNFNCL